MKSMMDKGGRTSPMSGGSLYASFLWLGVGRRAFSPFMCDGARYCAE